MKGSAFDMFDKKRVAFVCVIVLLLIISLTGLSFRYIRSVIAREEAVQTLMWEKPIIHRQGAGLSMPIKINSQNANVNISESELDNTNSPKNVPILSYHAVNDNIWGVEELYVSPIEFEKQMKYLKDNNYTAISFDQLENSSNYKKPVIITFDDGYEDNYTYAYPVLKKYDLKATIFLACKVIGKPHFLKIEQIIQMQDLISFQSHTLSHRVLTKLTPEEIENEMSESKRILEGLFGNEVNVLAYPEGKISSNISQIAKKYYKYAVLSYGGYYNKNSDPHEIKRIFVSRWMDIAKFEKKLKEAETTPVK